MLAGADWLTGGAFGLEGSAIALGLYIAASAGLLILMARRSQWRPFALRFSASVT
jgi:hypothetical protein